MGVMKELAIQKRMAGKNLVPPEGLIVDVWRAQEEARRKVKSSWQYEYVKKLLREQGVTWSDFQIMMAVQFIRLMDNPAKMWKFYDSKRGRKYNVSPDGDPWDRENEAVEAAWASARRLAGYCRNR